MSYTSSKPVNPEVLAGETVHRLLEPKNRTIVMPGIVFQTLVKVEDTPYVVTAAKQPLTADRLEGMYTDTFGWALTAQAVDLSERFDHKGRKISPRYRGEPFDLPFELNAPTTSSPDLLNGALEAERLAKAKLAEAVTYSPDVNA